jgi:bifunctional enzyme CysN/CysC
MTRFVEYTGGGVEDFLATQENKDLLRFITCGSVDDGKSTLIGRLLYESKMLFEDQLTALEADSKKLGRVAISTSHCWWMALRLNANRASP